MHTAAEGGSDENPEHSGQITKLSCEHGTYQWSRSGDGGEMVAEYYPLRRRDEIFAIAACDGGGCAVVVDGEHFGHDPSGVEAIRNRKGTDASNDEPQGVYGFASLESCDRDGGDSEQGNEDPQKNTSDTRHDSD